MTADKAEVRFGGKGQPRNVPHLRETRVSRQDCDPWLHLVLVYMRKGGSPARAVDQGGGDGENEKTIFGLTQGGNIDR